MGFGDAIRSGFRNYVKYSRRAARSEYWFWFLFAFLVAIAASLIDTFLIGSGQGPVYTITGLALFLPGLAVGIRRLHDRDRRGWWMFIVLIPIVGIIILIVWLVSVGTAGPNRFGPDRLAGPEPGSGGGDAAWRAAGE